MVISTTQYRADVNTLYLSQTESCRNEAPQSYTPFSHKGEVPCYNVYKEKSRSL